MAILLPKSRSLILEVPKTGSKWLRAAVGRSGVLWEQIGPEAWRGHGTLSVHGRGFHKIACFVRNPFEWYRTYWAWRQEKGWRPKKYELDRRCASPNFSEFVRTATTELQGYLSDLFEEYAGPEETPVDFVGHQEDLADGLVRFLIAAGEAFDERELRKTPRVNVSTERPEISEADSLLILLSEYSAFTRYGYIAHVRDPIGLWALCSQFPTHEQDFTRLGLSTDRAHWARDDARRRSQGLTAPGRSYARIMTNFGMYLEHVIGNINIAQRYYERAIDAFPDHPRSIGNYGRFLVTRLGRFAEGEALLRRSLNLRADQPDVLVALARLLRSKDRRSVEARMLLGRAIELEPDHAGALRVR